MSFTYSDKTEDHVLQNDTTGAKQALLKKIERFSSDNKTKTMFFIRVLNLIKKIKGECF